MTAIVQDGQGYLVLPCWPWRLGPFTAAELDAWAAFAADETKQRAAARVLQLLAAAQRGERSESLAALARDCGAAAEELRQGRAVVTLPPGGRGTMSGDLEVLGGDDLLTLDGGE